MDRRRPAAIDVGPRKRRPGVQRTPRGTPAEQVSPDLERATLARQGRREGREIRFLCPAHDDRNPSARWSAAKRAWVCDACKAGGDWRDLAERLGVSAREEGVRARGGGEVEAVYRYRDAGGEVVYEVVRKRPKGFACRRPAGPDRWIWNLQGVERVLYRLPEVLAAVGRGERIFVVEGEKDADALAALGLAATTNAGGAGKWRAGYGAALRGARVAVVPDNDEAGRAHGRRVAAALAAVAGEVAMVELAGLPEKGDVSDWIAGRPREGAGSAELAREMLELAAATAAAVLCAGEAGSEREAAAEGAAARREVAGERVAVAEGTAPRRVAATLAAGGRPALRSSRMSEVEPRQVHFLWRPYLPLGKLTLLEGDPGQGKSWVTAAIAACGSVGRGLPGMEAFEPFASLFFSTEDGKADTFRPRLDALGADSARVYGHDQPLYLDTPEGMAEIEREIAGRGPRLVVIDSVMSFVGARVDVYRANEVRAVLAPLAKLGERYGCAILALRHITKSRSGRAIYAGQGSIDFTATARSVLLAGSSAQDPGEHALLHIKSNVSALGASLGYRVDEGGFAWTGVTHLTAADLLAAEAAGEERAADEEARRFLCELLAAAPLPARQVFEEARKAGISEITLRRAKAREGVIVEKVGFQEGARWVWSIPSTSRRRS